MMDAHPEQIATASSYEKGSKALATHVEMIRYLQHFRRTRLLQPCQRKACLTGPGPQRGPPQKGMRPWGQTQKPEAKVPPWWLLEKMLCWTELPGLGTH